MKTLTFTLFLLLSSLILISSPKFKTINAVYPSKEIQKYTFEVTPGDYLIMASKSYVASTSIAIGGSVITGLCSIQDSKDIQTAGLIIGGVSIIASFYYLLDGHACVKKAGKLFNSQKSISFEPSKTGIGLCMKF